MQTSIPSIAQNKKHSCKVVAAAAAADTCAIQDALSKIKFDTVFMTPEWAERLVSNPKNRNRSRRKTWVETLSTACKAGEFVLTHQGIAVGPDWVVYDGQHRLAAIAKSGIGQFIVVAHYATHDHAMKAMLSVDRLARRQLGDMLEIIGWVNNKGQDRVAVANVISMLETGNGKRLTDSAVGHLVVKYMDDYDHIRAALPHKAAAAASVAAFVWVRRLDPDAVDFLANKIANKAHLTKAEVVLERVVNERAGSGSDSRMYSCLRVLRAIEAVLGAENISKIHTPDRAAIISRLQKRMGV